MKLTPTKKSTIIMARVIAVLACATCLLVPFYGFLLMFCAFAALDIGATKSKF